LVVVAVRQAATRATVAADATSLAIDERLRSDEAFAATGPLFFLLLVFPASTIFANSPTWLATMWAVAAVIIAVLRVWGEGRPPWQPARIGWSPTTPAPSGEGL
jgi:hypothetical protein